MALYDVVIAGGGAAGLSAALVLGRCRRSVLVCDDGHPRNEASHAVHCLLGNEGIPPVQLLAKGRQELRAYGHVALHDDKLVSIERGQTEFKVTCASGLRAAARKVLLTTGLQDEVPRIDGIEGLTAAPFIIALTATDMKAATSRSPSTAKATRAPGLR